MLNDILLMKIWLNKNIFNTRALGFGLHRPLVVGHAGDLRNHIVPVLCFDWRCRLGGGYGSFCWWFFWKQTSQIRPTVLRSLDVIIPMKNEVFPYLSWFSACLHLHLQQDWGGSVYQALHEGINSHLQGGLIYTEGKLLENNKTAKLHVTRSEKFYVSKCKNRPETCKLNDTKHET